MVGNFRVVEQMPISRWRCCSYEIYCKKVRTSNSKEYGIEGRVFVTFVIDKKGKVKDVEIIKGVDPNLDKEAKRVIEFFQNYSGKQR